MSKIYSLVQLGEILTKSEDWIDINPIEKYKQVTVKIWGKGVVERNEVTGAEIAASKRLKVHYGQFILSRIDARHGAFGLIPNSLDGAVVTNDFPVFTPNTQKILPEFLDWMSKTKDFIELCKAASEGTTNRVRLKEDKFLSMKIPLPPLEEQRRIVARVEELAGKVEEVRSLRQKALEEIEILLKSELLSIVNKLLKKYSYQQLNELILDAGYGTSAKCEYGRLNNSVPVLRIPNVASEQVNFDDIKYGLLTNTDLQRVLVSEGDILVVRTNGSAELVGRCAVVPTLPEATAFASYLIRLHCDRQQIDPYYLQLMLRHLRSAGQLFDFARTSAGQYNVSLGRLRAAKIPVPPLPEQWRIVAYLDELQTKLDTMKRLRQHAIKELDALLPSILDKAFKGEL